MNCLDVKPAYALSTGCIQVPDSLDAEGNLGTMQGIYYLGFGLPG